MPSPTTPRSTRRRRPASSAPTPRADIHTARMTPTRIPQRARIDRQPGSSRAPHNRLRRVGRQRILAGDLRGAAARRAARPDVDVLDRRVGDAGVEVVRALRAVVFHAQVLAEVGEVDDFAFWRGVSLFSFRGGREGEGEERRLHSLYSPGAVAKVSGFAYVPVPPAM